MKITVIWGHPYENSLLMHFQRRITAADFQQALSSILQIRLHSGKPNNLATC